MDRYVQSGTTQPVWIPNTRYTKTTRTHNTVLRHQSIEQETTLILSLCWQTCSLTRKAEKVGM